MRRAGPKVPAKGEPAAEPRPLGYRASRGDPPRSPPSLPACRRPAEAPRYSLPMAAAGREQRASGGGGSGGFGKTRQGLIPAAPFRFLPRAGSADRRRCAGAAARALPQQPPPSATATAQRLQLPSCTAAGANRAFQGGRRAPDAYWLPAGLCNQSDDEVARLAGSCSLGPPRPPS